MVTKRAKQRRSAQETREVLVSEGLLQLQNQGVLVGLEHVTLESISSAVGVPRSSSHAAWANDDGYAPKAMFQRAVVRAWLLTREDTLFSDAAQTAVIKALDQWGDALTAGDIIRFAIQAAYAEGIAAEDGGLSDFLSTDLAIRHSIASRPIAERDEEMLEWLRTGDVSNREKRIADTYKPMGELLQMEPRPEYGEKAYQHFAIAVAALAEGIALRMSVLPELELDQPIRELGDDKAPALLIGVCVESLAHTFFRPIA